MLYFNTNPNSPALGKMLNHTATYRFKLTCTHEVVITENRFIHTCIQFVPLRQLQKNVSAVDDTYLHIDIQIQGVPTSNFI